MTFYVIILFDSEGRFDADYNDVIAPFADRDEAKQWARKYVPDHAYAIVETTSPISHEHAL